MRILTRSAHASQISARAAALFKPREGALAAGAAAHTRQAHTQLSVLCTRALHCTCVLSTMDR